MTTEVVVVHHEARLRLQRTLYVAIGVAGLIFGALAAPGASGFMQQADQLAKPFALATILVGVVVPVLFIPLAFILPMRVMHIFAGTNALLFLMLHLAFPAAMLNDTLLNGGTPWLQSVNAVQATVAAVVWQRRSVWLYAVIESLIVIWVQVEAAGGDVKRAVLDGVGALSFMSIVMGIAIAVILAADRLDIAFARARAEASAQATSRAREREQSRINAIVHDDIMSVLVTAGREHRPQGLAVQAKAALASVASLESNDAQTREYPPDQAIAILRSAVGDADVPVTFTGEAQGDLPVSSAVLGSFGEAIGEALRNSASHGAWPDKTTARSATAVVSDAGIDVTIVDDGPGFNPRTVPPRRLGIKVSIVERMRLVDGGDADITSRPGSGTTVHLTWRRS